MLQSSGLLFVAGMPLGRFDLDPQLLGLSLPLRKRTVGRKFFAAELMFLAVIQNFNRWNIIV